MKYIKIEDLIPEHWYQAMGGAYYFFFKKYEEREGYYRIHYFYASCSGTKRINDYFASDAIDRSIEEVKDWNIIKEMYPDLMPEETLQTYSIY